MSADTVYLALYKGHRDGAWYQPKVSAARLGDWLIRTFTRSPYSHCEIAVNKGNGQYACYSASLRDGGVRCKTMPLPDDKWDLIPIRDADAYDRVWALYQNTRGAKYDFGGALGVVLPIRQAAQKWFCSEWCAAALGLPWEERVSPNSLAKHLSDSILDTKRMHQTLAKHISKTKG